MKQKIKIVFLGDKGVGKSSIIGKFIHNKFEENSEVHGGICRRLSELTFSPKCANSMEKGTSCNSGTLLGRRNIVL